MSNHISELDKDMAKAVILLASSEMTKVKVRGVPAKPPSAPGLPDSAMAQGFLSQVFLPQVLGCGFVSGCLGISPSVLHTDCPPGWGGSPCRFRGGN